MNAADFTDPNTGTLVKTIKGNWAFVPAPLPPEIVFDPALVMALSSADAALSELSGLGSLLPNPHLLIAPYTRREAVLSSRIEGTEASLSDLFADELAEAKDTKGAVHEVANYVTALEFAIARLRELPLSLRLIRETHEKLMRGVRGDSAHPGQFRESQVFIGPPGSTEETATHVPPPPLEMNQALGEWEKYLHADRQLPDLINCALIHVQFEAIHPFLDGNGRVGRLLITLYLMSRRRLSQPLLYLSAFIDAHRREYYELLNGAHTRGEWRAWIDYFLAGVTAVARDARDQAKELLQLRDELRSRVRDVNALNLIDALFINPYITIKHAEKLLGKTYPTAKKTIDTLVARQILLEITGRERNKVYLAKPIYGIIGREAKF